MTCRVMRKSKDGLDRATSGKRLNLESISQMSGSPNIQAHSNVPGPKSVSHGTNMKTQPTPHCEIKSSQSHYPLALKKIHRPRSNSCSPPRKPGQFKPSLDRLNPRPLTSNPFNQSRNQAAPSPEASEARPAQNRSPTLAPSPSPSETLARTLTNPDYESHISPDPEPEPDPGPNNQPHPNKSPYIALNLNRYPNPTLTKHSTPEFDPNLQSRNKLSHTRESNHRATHTEAQAHPAKGNRVITVLNHLNPPSPSNPKEIFQEQNDHGNGNRVLCVLNQQKSMSSDLDLQEIRDSVQGVRRHSFDNATISSEFSHDEEVELHNGEIERRKQSGRDTRSEASYDEETTDDDDDDSDDGSEEISLNGEDSDEDECTSKSSKAVKVKVLEDTEGYRKKKKNKKKKGKKKASNALVVRKSIKKSAGFLLPRLARYPPMDKDLIRVIKRPGVI